MKDCSDDRTCSAFMLLQNITALKATVSLDVLCSLNVILGSGIFLQDMFVEHAVDWNKKRWSLKQISTSSWLPQTKTLVLNCTVTTWLKLMLIHKAENLYSKLCIWQSCPNLQIWNRKKLYYLVLDQASIYPILQNRFKGFNLD